MTLLRIEIPEQKNTMESWAVNEKYVLISKIRAFTLVEKTAVWYLEHIEAFADTMMYFDQIKLVKILSKKKFFLNVEENTGREEPSIISLEVGSVSVVNRFPDPNLVI